MKVIRDTVGLIADITGILAFIGLSATGVIAWMGPKGSPLVVIFPGAFILLLVIYFGLKKFAPDFTESAFRSAPTNKPLLLQAYELKDRLPTDEILQEMQAELRDRIQKWDEKAQWIASELNVTMTQGGQLYTLSILTQSTWKKREAEFSIKADGRQKTRVMEYFQTLNKPARTSIDKAFFHTFSNWRDKVVLAYGPIEHQPKSHLYVKVGITTADKGLRVLVSDDSKEIGEPKA